MTHTSDSPDRERLELDCGGRTWRLERVADLEALWDQMTEGDFGEDDRLPYWAELWPASLALVEHLGRVRARIAGRACLDLGCGLGLTAIAGALHGARVLGMDYELDALRHAARNADLNLDQAGPPPLWALMDWRAPGVRPGSIECLWAGDILYEKRFIEPVADFLDHALAPDGVAWLAGPERRVHQPFGEHMASLGFARKKVLTNHAVFPFHSGQGPLVKINIWELRRR